MIPETINNTLNVLLTNLIGSIGLILITFGVLTKDRRKQLYLFSIGGILLEIYSILKLDIVFIILQLIFTIASIYEIFNLEKD